MSIKYYELEINITIVFSALCNVLLFFILVKEAHLSAQADVIKIKEEDQK